MSARLEQLAAKREALLATSATQRDQLTRDVREVETHLGSIDRALGTARRLVKNPIVLAGGVALVALIGPRKIVRIASRGALMLSAGKRVLRLLGRS